MTILDPLLRPLLAAMLPIVAVLGLLPAAPASAASSDSYADPALTARLITAENGVKPGARTLSAGLDIRLGDDWKTYWRSPGEVGFPPSIDWQGSRNIAEVEFLWPAPTRFTAFGIENFGYSHRVVFPLRVVLENPGEPARLAATVNLLACSNICVPHTFPLTLDLPAGDRIDPEAANLIAEFANRVPATAPAGGIALQGAALSDDMTSLTLAISASEPFRSPDVFPELGSRTAFGAPDIRLGDDQHQLWARLPVLAIADELPPLSVTVTDGERAFALEAALDGTPPEPPYEREVAAPALGLLLGTIVLAFLGGLVLNVMPCVLPVLSIKLSSVIASHGQGRGRIRGGFLMSAAGVLAFMWLLAAATMAARMAGLNVGWGLQFQNPVFLAAMFVLVAVFAANLLGAFEINLPASLQTRLATEGNRHGYAGDFATGAFAAVLATPCSAPFLGTAVAFALSGRPIDVLIIFTALGLGLALPYLLIAAFPQVVAWLPKPGRWMLLVKIALGLMLALTAAWLVWVLNGVGGSLAAIAVLALTGILLVLLSLHTGPRLLKASLLPIFVALPLAASAYWSTTGPDRPAPAPLDAEWVAFDRAQIARLVSQGQVVFVDVTADWCLTCKANKALVIDRDPVAAALAAPQVTMMQADWTRPDERISQYLAGFGRYGIPFNAVYGPGAPDGIALSEILSAPALLDALVQAEQRAVASQ